MDRFNLRKLHPQALREPSRRVPLVKRMANANQQLAVIANRVIGRSGHRAIGKQNLEVIQVREEDNILLIKGAIPGSEGDYVVIRESKKRPRGWKAPVATLGKKD